MVVHVGFGSGLRCHSHGQGCGCGWGLGACIDEAKDKEWTPVTNLDCPVKNMNTKPRRDLRVLSTKESEITDFRSIPSGWCSKDHASQTWTSQQTRFKPRPSLVPSLSSTWHWVSGNRPCSPSLPMKNSLTILWKYSPESQFSRPRLQLWPSLKGFYISKIMRIKFVLKMKKKWPNIINTLKWNVRHC